MKFQVCICNRFFFSNRAHKMYFFSIEISKKLILSIQLKNNTVIYLIQPQLSSLTGDNPIVLLQIL